MYFKVVKCVSTQPSGTYMCVGNLLLTSTLWRYVVRHTNSILLYTITNTLAGRNSLSTQSIARASFQVYRTKHACPTQESAVHANCEAPRWWRPDVCMFVDGVGKDWCKLVRGFVLVSDCSGSRHALNLPCTVVQNAWCHHRWPSAINTWNKFQQRRYVKKHHLCELIRGGYYAPGTWL